MVEVSALKAFRKGKRIVPLSFRKARVLQRKHHDAAPSLDTSLLKPKGIARSQGKRVAVLFSGGPASGGHDVLCGIADVLEGNTLLGVRGGPAGLLNGDVVPLDTRRLRGTGGFHALGTDRTKLAPHLDEVKEICAKHRIDALVIIGGDDSNTNAAFLAEHLQGVQVIGVPKTMDCDLQAPPWLTCTFGFDTACGIYAEMVANLLADTLSIRKYWHFVRLMGRDASHVTLEVALRTHPTLALISEEEGWMDSTLSSIVDRIIALVRERRLRGQDYGVILIPEGLLEHLPSMRKMMDDIAVVWRSHEHRLERKDLVHRRKYLARKLSGRSQHLYLSFPQRFQEMLALDRDAHGNVKVSQLPTEELLADLVRARLEDGLKTVTHFYGYEGRCGVPSAFDSWLGYNLGLTAGSLVADGRTGYLAAISDIARGGSPCGIPLASMLDVVRRDGEDRIAIRKRLVEKDDKPFRALVHVRGNARHDDAILLVPRDLKRIVLPISVRLEGS